MPWRLKRDYQMKHAKTGETLDRTSYHCGFIMGMPEGTSRPQDATEFPTKAAAQAHQRDRLPGRGYRPERVN